MTTGPGLPKAAVRRITAAVIARERQRLRAGDESGPGEGRAYAVIAPDTPLALDSLETMGVAAALGETFVREDFVFPPEDATAPAAWADRIAAQAIEQITVRTSGSTGAPKSHTHETAELRAEANGFAHRFASVKRVVALVPADHLYGVVWTALLPAILDVPVVDGAIAALPELRSGDLIVGVPEHWAALSRFRHHWPADVTGISSGGPLANATGEALLASGLAHLFDIYGTSETSAIGLREVPEDGYALIERWDIRSDGNDTVSLADRHGQSVVLPDHIRQIGPRRIVLEGRRDHAVQVGGHNVYPARIARLLMTHDSVAEAVVRPGDNGRLKAFVVPAGHQDCDALEQRLRELVEKRLIPAERPTRFRFGPALPINRMGKSVDWD